MDWIRRTYIYLIMGLLKRKCSYGCLLNRYLKKKAVKKLKDNKEKIKEDAREKTKQMGAYD